MKAAKALNRSGKVLASLFAFRVVNALVIRTFFQPDEYFQSLEPAWQIAFGEHSGAWITWEWKEGLRSSLHPALFAGIYYASDLLASAFHVSPSSRAEILLVGPKALQAALAALVDYFTWKYARRMFGNGSNASYAALCLTVFSPWQWFCSTRTLSNCLETTLTIIALYLWPPQTSTDSGVKSTAARVVLQKGNRVYEMRWALAFAALATILRPTNVIIWIVIAVYTAADASAFSVTGTLKALLLESREALISGAIVLTASMLSDRAYYQSWIFPPARFVHFNVVQSLAVFYGRNRPDYYITEGLPLLLTLTLPFAAVGLWQALLGSQGNKAGSGNPRVSGSQLRPLAVSVIVFIAVMSVISHKEVRFIYPLLPVLHVLAAGPVARFFRPLPWPASTAKKAVLIVAVTLNITFALYVSLVHQRGVVDVTHFLRHQYERMQALDAGSAYTTPTSPASDMTVLFAMPCHSTPWRSHLVYQGIKARALTCEPPLDIPYEERAAYLDEADHFYADPTVWMKTHMRDPPRADPSKDDVRSLVKSAWPEYLVFFEQLEPTMKVFLQDTRYKECWRGFNTHWHDDWRRSGDVLVWCLNWETQQGDVV